MDIHYNKLFEMQLDNAASQGDDVLEHQLNIITRNVTNAGMLRDLDNVLAHRVDEAIAHDDSDKIVMFTTYRVVIQNVLEQIETSA